MLKISSYIARMTPNSLKILRDLHLNYLITSHPEHDEEYLKQLVKATKYNDSTANGLTNCIEKFFKFHGKHCERINTTGRWIADPHKRKGGYYIKTAGKKGSADLHALAFGKAFYIEVKIGKDRQSKEQQAFQKSVEYNGGVYLIVKSFDDFLKQFNEKTYEY